MLQPPATTATILIIDDQESNLRLLERVLISAGYKAFVSSTDPLKAVDLYRQYRPDLVVLDLHMPMLDGIGVLERLDAAHARGHLRAGPRDHRRPEPDDQAAGALGRRQGLPRQAVRCRSKWSSGSEPARGPLRSTSSCRRQNEVLEENVAQRTLRAGGRAARDPRSACRPRRRSSATTTRCSTRERVGAMSAALAEALGLPDEPRQDAPARGAAARHRQDRRARQHPAEAGRADAGRVRRHQDAHRRSARASCRAAPTCCCRWPRRSRSPITSAGTGHGYLGACTVTRSRWSAASSPSPTSSTR